MMGRNAAPIDSLVSANAMPSFFMPPAAVFAAASPAPPKFLVSTACTSARLAPSFIIALISGLSALKAFMLPACARANASVTSTSGLPVAAATSVAKFINSVALATSLVATISF